MKPLEDVRIIALEQYGAGPFGSVQLADMGAEVIKIEDPRSGGDVGRHVPPYQEGDSSLFFETFNRNKRSINLDVTSSAGRQVFEDLVRCSDAVYSNLRGDVPARLRIRYGDLSHLNPRVVCCSLSGFGMTGPRHGQPGYDYILQGIAGWMSLTGEPGEPPAKSGLSLVDYCGGLVAALSMVIGVHAARRDGTGMDCDVSLFDTAMSLLTYLGTWHLTSGFEPQRTARSAHPSIVPFQNFRTRDGWIVIACAKQKFFEALAPAILKPELVDDPRFKDFEARRAHMEELTAILDEVLETDTTESWVSRLVRAGVPCGPVNSVQDAVRDPQVAARELVVETEHPVLGMVRQIPTAVRVGNPREDHRRAPMPREDTDYVLSALLGYEKDKFDELSSAGAFGDPTDVDRREQSSERG
ncbi:MAG: CoA transferase [Actinobacteria bacterium]|nr:CoA transferase [Actinomycetota bacterium]